MYSKIRYIDIKFPRFHTVNDAINIFLRESIFTGLRISEVKHVYELRLWGTKGWITKRKRNLLPQRERFPSADHCGKLAVLQRFCLWKAAVGPVEFNLVRTARGQRRPAPSRSPERRGDSDWMDIDDLNTSWKLVARSYADMPNIL